MGTPLIIHQPAYSMLNRWVEHGLLDVLAKEGIGCAAFSPLAQGMLSDRYLNGVPAGSRASEDDSLPKGFLTEENLSRVRELADIARGRGQTLSQMAIAWVLRDQRVTTAIFGASSLQQLEANVASLSRLSFTDDELREIDHFAVDAGVDLWAGSHQS
jgi:L-glyceraldehyde 3-phosphate reductase